MHLGLTLDALSLSELRALGFDGSDFLLLLTDLVVDCTRADSILGVLLRAVNCAAMVAVAGIHCIPRTGSGVLGDAVTVVVTKCVGVVLRVLVCANAVVLRMAVCTNAVGGRMVTMRVVLDGVRLMSGSVVMA